MVSPSLDRALSMAGYRVVRVAVHSRMPVQITGSAARPEQDIPPVARSGSHARDAGQPGLGRWINRVRLGCDSKLQILVVRRIPAVCHDLRRFEPKGSRNELIQQFRPAAGVDDTRQPRSMEYVEHFVE